MNPLILAAILTATSVLAQPQGRPEFDVATLKLPPPPAGNTININLGRL
jgi:hypothetical protein